MSTSSPSVTASATTARAQSTSSLFYRRRDNHDARRKSEDLISDLRDLKAQQEVSGCYWSEWGAEVYATIRRDYLATLR
jgi:hypothetical protein